MKTPAGQLVPINHETTWLWFNERGGQQAWSLAKERIGIVSLDSSAGELLRADADEAELAVPEILAVVEERQE